MYQYGCDINNAAWKYSIPTRDGVDTVEGLRIRYTGSQVAAHVTVASTTNDMTFEQGASTAAAAVGTGDNPGSSGVIDMSAVDDIHELNRIINLAADWEAWLTDLPPDADVEISAGNGIFVVSTDSDCTLANGFAVLTDTSLLTAETFSVGLTNNGPSTKTHAHDRQQLLEIVKIVAKATFAGATDGLYIYECDDVAGSKVEIAHFALVSATITTIGTGDTPLVSTTGKRLVVQAVDASGAITVPKIEIFGRTVIIGPSVRVKKLWAYTQDS